MKTVLVNDYYQQNYRYCLSKPTGKNFGKNFKPELTPKQMLEIGVFGGKYMSDKPKEFPKSWFNRAKISNIRDPELNYFSVNASLSLREWLSKGWINEQDPRGWFQWYCRYYMGRRVPGYDDHQIKRWKAMKRHLSQIISNCRAGDQLCRRAQKQALLHWAYDTRKI